MTERCGWNLELAKRGGWPYYYWYTIGFTAVLNIFACIACIYVIIAILANRYVRANSFNLYVVFMLIPDCVNAFLNFLMGAFRIRHCGKVVRILGDWFDFNVSFYYFCNFSLNCAVAWELHSLLNHARRFSRAGPPPMKQTLLRIFGAYSFALLFAVWGVVDVPWSWYHRRKNRFGSPPGGVFSEMQSIVMVGSLMILLILFVIGIRIRVWRKQLLPKKGRTRVVSVFFERIVVVFLVFYFPTLTLLMVSTIGNSYSHMYFWIERALQFLSALQVFTTLWAVSQKPDIHYAVFRCGRKRTRSSVSLTRRPVTEESDTTGGAAVVENALTSDMFAAPNDASRQQSQLTSDHLSAEIVSSAFISAPFLAAEKEWGMMDVYDSDESEEEIVFSPVDRNDDGADEEENPGRVDQQTSVGMSLRASRKDSTILDNNGTNESTE